MKKFLKKILIKLLQIINKNANEMISSEKKLDFQTCYESKYKRIFNKEEYFDMITKLSIELSEDVQKFKTECKVYTLWWGREGLQLKDGRISIVERFEKKTSTMLPSYIIKIDDYSKAEKES